MAFVVSLQHFSGSLEHLCKVVESGLLNLVSVPLITVVAGYIAYLDKNTEEPINQAGDAVWLLARLIRSKAEALLPTTSSVVGEADDRANSVTGLVFAEQLKLYHQFRAAAAYLAQMAHRRSSIYRRPVGAELKSRPMCMSSIGSVSPQKLLSVLLALRSASSHPWVPPQRVITVGDQVEYLRRVVGQRLCVRFDDILMCRAEDNRCETVVMFLAVLELVRRGEIDVEQNGAFGPIWLRWIGGQLGIA